MSPIENEVASRGWGPVLEELSGLASRERNAALGGDTRKQNELLGTLNAATRVGRDIDAGRVCSAGVKE